MKRNFSSANTKKRASSSRGKTKDKFGMQEVSRGDRWKFFIGIFICATAFYLLISFISYLIFWKYDAGFVNSNLFSSADIVVENWGGKLGFTLSRFFISYGFGISAFFIVLIIGSIGLRILGSRFIKIVNVIVKLTFAMILVSLWLSFCFINNSSYLLSGAGGAFGYFCIEWLRAFLGNIGTGTILTITTIAYVIFAFGIDVHKLQFRQRNSSPKKEQNNNDSVEESSFKANINNVAPNIVETTSSNTPPHTPLDGKIIHDANNGGGEYDNNSGAVQYPEQAQEVNLPDDITINRPTADDIISDNKIDNRVEIYGEYDPKLELSRFKFPPVTILKDYKNDSTFDEEEVHENKDKIIRCLADFNINITQITATVGPTVTLYEVVPARGVKIAKIQSLEDDIAMNLSALGIRIIAPMPGRGTVGLEVPNKRPQTVSMKSLICSENFQHSKMEIPLALGRTITNDPFIIDLTKMPHLLVAGATGQGKSVGINAIITSILYKKHPAELKFVLIDPKRVELPLYTKIERHYLAKLPGEEDAIITDTQKVINTLNSLCMEMDHRYDLLKMAGTRNIKEYNDKFIARKLSPEKGHHFMPYIVLIIDEFADLIMTAGREIERPIGRLAQLSRAIGIHLIISTQRPSTNVITGFIKANFPARIAFRVVSYIDSRTILDTNGAERLVGRGDMLVSTGAGPERVQCAFVDTPEVESLTDYIGEQQGFIDAFLLPEYIDENSLDIAEVDLGKKDPKFDEAARLVVSSQQGSTSLIQRKLQLGYNRAGRIIDQLEAAGIVGPFEGSKAREVLFTDMAALEQHLQSLS